MLGKVSSFQEGEPPRWRHASRLGDEDKLVGDGG